MARRLHQQRRGKGSPKYLSSKNANMKVKYPFNYTTEKLVGEVVDILHNAGKTAPIAQVLTNKGDKFYLQASEGSYVGLHIEIGSGSKLSLNSVVPIREVNPGFTVYNIESRPGKGGNFLRTSGSYGQVIAQDDKGVYVKMKSGEKKLFDGNCLVTLGIVAGSGRQDKPFMKAGNKFHAEKAKGGRIYPVVRGYAMNAVDHPHGGSGHNSPGRQKNVSRKYAAPGQKVGHIAPSRTGRRKK